MSKSKVQVRVSKTLPATLKPQTELSPAAQAVWDLVIESVTHEHFQTADLLMLESYCTARVVLGGIEKRVMENPDDSAALKAYKESLAGVVSLAVKLRLTPSSRNPRKDSAYSPKPFPPGFYGTPMR